MAKRGARSKRSAVAYGGKDKNTKAAATQVAKPKVNKPRGKAIGTRSSPSKADKKPAAIKSDKKMAAIGTRSSPRKQDNKPEGIRKQPRLSQGVESLSLPKDDYWGEESNQVDSQKP